LKHIEECVNITNMNEDVLYLRDIFELPEKYTGKVQYSEPECVCYYVEGKLHKESSPAVEYPNGTKFWYKNGLMQQEPSIQSPHTFEIIDPDHNFRGTSEEYNKMLETKKEKDLYIGVTGSGNWVVGTGPVGFTEDQQHYITGSLPRDHSFKVTMEQQKSEFELAAEEIGKLVTEKNKAYGNSFEQAEQFLKLLFPDGIPVESYSDMLCIVRIFDKLKRVATDKNAFSESPFADIIGYGILGLVKDRKQGKK
jgi:hypothetical protein